MKRLLVMGFVMLASAPPAWAQPDDEDDVDEDSDDSDDVDSDDSDTDTDTDRDTDRDPPRDPDPEPEPDPVAAPAGRRPEGMSIAIGAGYSLPTDNLKAPDITTVRLRLRSGLTLEPLLTLSRASSTVDDGTNAVTTTTTDLSLRVLIRYPFRLNDRVDLSLCGALGLGQQSVEREAMLPDDSTTTIGLEWGFALDYWVKRHWAISATALNPFASLAKTTSDVGGVKTSTSTNLIGIIFDPSIFLTVHLYF